MIVNKTKLPGVLIIEPRIFKDPRGLFFESFRENLYAEHGMTMPFVQDNVSRSQKGTLRGLHYQREQTQGKLVWVTHGKVFDVIVDVRFGSPTFGQWISAILDDESCQQVYMPPGFAHGFCVLSATADFTYKCTDYYHPQSEVSVQWNDPALNIDWPMRENLLISDKDKEGRILKNIPSEELPQYEDFQ